MRITIKYFFQGGLIGIGNIIPGVSGATIALLLGIYKRLITAIDALNIQSILAVLKSLPNLKNFKEEMHKIQGGFLTAILLGVLTFVYIFSFAISYSLDHYHDATYSLFFGLILASVVIPLRLAKDKKWYNWIIALLAIVIVVSLSFGITVEDQAKAHQKKTMIKKGIVQSNIETNYYQLGYYFLAGAIAISAMILPGISGSFILLLMGSYFDILLAIKQLNILLLAFFGCGCLVGLIGFTKIMKYLLEKYESALMFFLSGLIFGSLYSIWPFKEVLVVDDMVFYGKNVLPNIYNLHFLVCLGVCLVGIILVKIFSRHE
ncbi:DUF368 domain-containing protein [Candidatus Uabimicrobium sp. HlEnr_7]|uniref:DUF368 domain-containing protein n=1 Tax=Candidatus Uabimicrobium helgolandensis TaxID=3095367 RepID=UPI003557B0FB